MPDEKQIVMFDSPEAARKVEQVGWKSRDGIFYPGDNPSSERGARWSGCTHMTCACGKVHEKSRTKCSGCIAKERTEKYYAMPMVEWDGVTPVCTFDDDRYFFDEGEVLDWMADLKHNAAEGESVEVQLVLCDPGHLHLLEQDVWCDDLPEDGELPGEVLEKLDELNKALSEAPTVCWWPGKQRIDVDALWAQLKKDQDAEVQS